MFLAQRATTKVNWLKETVFIISCTEVYVSNTFQIYFFKKKIDVVVYHIMWLSGYMINHHIDLYFHVTQTDPEVS
jgi:hypothetical protein